MAADIETIRLLIGDLTKKAINEQVGNGDGVGLRYKLSMFPLASAPSAVLTITLSTTAGMIAGEILLLESVTHPTGSGYSASDFDDKTFMITEVVVST